MRQGRLVKIILMPSTIPKKFLFERLEEAKSHGKISPALISLPTFQDYSSAYLEDSCQKTTGNREISEATGSPKHRIKIHNIKCTLKSTRAKENFRYLRGLPSTRRFVTIGIELTTTKIVETFRKLIANKRDS